MKRKGHVYERVTTWEMVKRAQIESSKNKPNSYGVLKHKKHWLRELIQLHEKALAGTMSTGDYVFESVVSGQDKMRDIAKLYYYPDNIWHQMLILATEIEVDRSFIGHAYANRKGKGQVAALKKLQQWIKEDPNGTLWYAKGDICKYYASIPHELVRTELYRTFKDKKYNESIIETVEKFSDTGVGIPLGTRPSQMLGNLCLRRFHRFAKEELHIKYFLSYLDDFWIFGKTNGEVKRHFKRIEKFLNDLGFKLHAPVFSKLENGVDGLGFVTYPGGESYWRRKNKCRWLKRRSRLKNKKRIRELDAAAWGALKHGCKECQKLYKMISITDIGVSLPSATDKDGNKIIDFPRIGMQTVLGSEVTVIDFVENVTTKMGPGRMAVAVIWNGGTYKVITNSQRVKLMISALAEKNVTKFKCRFISKGGNNIDIEVIDILQINGFDVEKNENGQIVYTHNKQIAL